MISDDLRQRAREAIRGGKIPQHPVKRMWGGPGAGEACTICSQPVGGLGIDLEFSQETAKYAVHIDCFAAWQAECENQARLAPQSDRGAT